MWHTQAKSFATVAVARSVDDAATLALNTPFGSLLADYYPPEARGRVFALRGLTGPDHRGGRARASPARWSTTSGGARPGSCLPCSWSLAGFYALFKLREPVRGFMERQAMGAN